MNPNTQLSLAASRTVVPLPSEVLRNPPPPRHLISLMFLSASEATWHKSLLLRGWHHKGLSSYPMLVRKGFPYPVWSHHNRKTAAMGGKGLLLTVSFNMEIFKSRTDVMRFAGRRECMRDLWLETHSLCSFWNLWETIWVHAVIEFFPAPNYDQCQAEAVYWFWSRMKAPGQIRKQKTKLCMNCQL